MFLVCSLILVRAELKYVLYVNFVYLAKNMGETIALEVTLEVCDWKFGKAFGLRGCCLAIKIVWSLFLTGPVVCYFDLSLARVLLSYDLKTAKPTQKILVYINALEMHFASRFTKSASLCSYCWNNMMTLCPNYNYTSNSNSSSF